MTRTRKNPSLPSCGVSTVHSLFLCTCYSGGTQASWKHDTQRFLFPAQESLKHDPPPVVQLVQRSTNKRVKINRTSWISVYNLYIWCPALGAHYLFGMHQRSWTAFNNFKGFRVQFNHAKHMFGTFWNRIERWITSKDCRILRGLCLYCGVYQKNPIKLGRPGG